MPIISLYKTQVRKLAELIRVPENIITKKSSPYLWKEQTAEGEIGVSYEEIDSILYCIFHKKLSIEDTAKTTQIELGTVEKIIQLNKNSEHKRATSVKAMKDPL